MSVRVRSLSKRFGAVTALDGVDLDLGADELLVVLGPTGAGKTTLLRLLSGLDAPDAGTIRLGDRDAASLSPADRDVALVFQNFSLYGDRSVRENLAFPLRAPGRKLDEAAIAERIAWAARLLALGDHLDKPAAKLSGGQMQRVAIGRAIVRQPTLFLMDEPLTNLDAKLREQLRVELAVLRRTLGIPMIYVTHDQAEALSMGDRVLVLDQGRVLQVGTPEDIYVRPASPTVARLLGQPRINLIAVRADAGRWRSDLGHDLGPATGASATLGIRPEHLIMTTGSDATVTLVEHLGPTRIVHLDWRGWTVQALVPKDVRVTRGDRVHLSIDPGHVLAWSV